MPVAVITGASRGLGKEIALALGRNGYNIAVNYLASAQEAESVTAAIGESAVSIKADVGDIRQVEEMADMVYRKWGRVDALINNAGITRDNLLIKTREDDWDEVLRINLKGCFNAIKTFAHVMIRAGRLGQRAERRVGHIINISSYSGLKGKEGQAAYSASKAAILGLTYTAARELAEHNIKVNALLPGYMKTEMGMSAESAIKKAMTESIAGGLSNPVDAAGFILYLLKSENITGQFFCLDSRIL